MLTASSDCQKTRMHPKVCAPASCTARTLSPPSRCCCCGTGCDPELRASSTSVTCPSPGKATARAASTSCPHGQRGGDPAGGSPTPHAQRLWTTGAHKNMAQDLAMRPCGIALFVTRPHVAHFAPTFASPCGDVGLSRVWCCLRRRPHNAQRMQITRAKEKLVKSRKRPQAPFAKRSVGI